MAFYLMKQAGATNVAVPLKIIDSSTGAPETAVTATTAGIAMWYRREFAAAVTITTVNVTVAQAHSDGGIIHILDGRYRLDLPDAAAATGVAYCEYGGAVTGMIVIGGLFQLTGEDPGSQWPGATIKAIVTTTLAGDGSGTPWGPA